MIVNGFLLLQPVDDFISVNSNKDNVSISSRRKKKVRKAIEDIKKMDPGYHAVIDKSGERVFEFYETNPNPGAKLEMLLLVFVLRKIE